MIDIAIDTANKASALALRYFKNQPKIKYKPDNSPVTRADIEVEKLIRKIIIHKYPEHGIVGEELPPIRPEAKYQWIIDPIDGTRDFIRGIPFWAIFIAVLKEKRPVISVISMPAIDTLILAQKGKGTSINGKRAHVSKTKNLKEAYISFGSIKRFQQYDYLKKLEDLTEKIAAPRSYANLGLIYLLEGKIDIVVEALGSIYDFAAPSLMVEEAGGKFTDFRGNFSLTSTNALMSNGLLHNQVLRILNH